jgi:hypothetical protein
MPVKVNQPMSKKAAQAAAGKSKPAPKQKPKPASKAAKPKGKSGATLHNKGKKAEAKIDPKRQAKALDLDKRMSTAMGGWVDSGKEAMAVAKEMEKGGYWKELPEKPTSFSNWLAKHAEKTKVSIRTLRLGIGFEKALPGVSQEKRDEIGPRKGALLTSAQKKAAAEGKNLPDEIIDAAPKMTESELARKLEADGFREPSAPVIEGIHTSGDAPRSETESRDSDPLIEEPWSDRAPESEPVIPRTSGIVEGAHGDAQQFSNGVADAVAVARVLYAEDLPEPAADSDALELICKHFMSNECRRPDLNDMTNSQAFDSLGGKLPSEKAGKKKKK